MDYSLNAGEWNKVFAVPSSVVDKYIKLASGNSLKLLLYLMRHGGEVFTDDKLRSELGFEEKGELEDAALFWVQRGIIRADSDKESMTLTASSAKPAEISHEVSEPPAKRSVPLAKPPAVSGSEIAQKLKNSPELKTLFDNAQTLLGRMLTQSDNVEIYRITEYYGLPCQVALMLIGYCQNLKDKHGKTITVNYISKVARNWSEEEIMTVQMADEKIRFLEKQNSVEERICKKMGLTSRPTADTVNFIKAAIDRGFSEEMIMLAYDKTVDGTGKWSPSYANRIIENWKNAGITSPLEAEKSDESFRKSSSTKKPASSSKRNRASAPENSSLDYDEIEAQLLNKYKK